MAIYTSTRGSGRGGSRWLYVALFSLVIVVVVAAVYKRFGKSKSEGSATLTSTGVEKETKAPPIAAPEPEPKPEPAPQAEPNLSEAALASVAGPNSKAVELITEAMELLKKQPAEIIKARDILNDALLPADRQQQEFVKEQLSELADKWLFSRDILPQDRLCSRYEVKPGDRLSEIGKQYKVPYEILMEINGIKRAETLPAGGTIKVINGPFHARVSRSTFTMDLYLQKTFVRSFTVGLGMTGRQTPTGLWVVKPGGKSERPIWTDPDTGIVYHPEDPNYPLGSVWIELEGLEGEAVGQMSFGIHGTKDPKTIGAASSRGCIRLNNGDAILVYHLLEPGYSRVRVLE